MTYCLAAPESETFFDIFQNKNWTKKKRAKKKKICRKEIETGMGNGIRLLPSIQMNVINSNYNIFCVFFQNKETKRKMWNKEISVKWTVPPHPSRLGYGNWQRMDFMDNGILEILSFYLCIRSLIKTFVIHGLLRVVI